MAVLLWAVFQLAAFFVLRQDRFLAGIKRALDRAASSRGLALSIGRMRPVGLNGLELEDLVLRDRRRAIIRVKRVYLRLEPLGFLRAPRHPEAAVAEIALDRPRVVLGRDAGGAWWWARFKTTSGRRYFRPLVKLYQAEIEEAEPLFGRPLGRWKVGTAFLDLRDSSWIRGWAVGTAAFDPGLRLTVHGVWNPASARGSLRCAWEGADLLHWQRAGWLPVERVRFFGGKAAGEVELALGPHVGLRKATVRLIGARLAPTAPGWPVLDVETRMVFADRLLKIKAARVRIGRNAFDLIGRLDLRAGDPPLSGEVRFSRLDPAVFPEMIQGLAIRGAASGRVLLGGTLSRPSLQGRLFFSGAASHPLLPAMKGLRITAHFSGQTLIFDSLRAETEGGALAGKGRFRLLPSPSLALDFTAHALRAEKVLTPLGFSGGRGNFDLEGRLTWLPGEWGLAGRTIWHEMTWAGNPLPAGRADFSLYVGKNALRLTAAGSVGRRGEFLADLRRTGGNWQGAARLKELDLAPFASFLPPAFRDLQGEATGGLGWRRREGKDEALFTGAIKNLTVAGRSLDEFKANLTWQGTEVVVETGQIRSEGGSASFHGRFDWRRKEVELDLLAHRFPLALLATDLGGWLEGRLQVEGTWPRGLAGAGRLYGAALTWQELSLGLGEADFTLADGRILLRKAHLISTEGEAEFAGTIGLVDRKELDLEGRIDFAAGPWSRLLPGTARLAGRVTGTARLLGTAEAPELTADLLMGSGSAYGVTWDSLTATLRWREGRLRIEQGTLRKAGAILAINGEVARDGYALSAEVHEADLKRLLPSLPLRLPAFLRDLSGRLTLEAEIGGSLLHPSVTGRVAIDHPALRGWESTEIAGYFSFDGKLLLLPRLVATSGEQFYTVYGLVDFDRRRLALDFGIDQGDLAGLLGLLPRPLLPWPLKGLLEGRGKITGSFARPEVEVSFRLEKGDLAGFGFTGEVSGRYDGQALVCDRLRLDYQGGGLTAAGRLAPEEMALTLDVAGLPLGEVFRLAGRPEQIEGRADLRLSFRRGPGQMEGAVQVVAGHGLKIAGIALDRAVLEGRLANRLLVLSRTELVAGGSPLSLTGRIPLPEKLAFLSSLLRGVPADQDGLVLKLEGKAVPTALFNPILQDFLVFREGKVDMALELSGTWENPRLQGTARLIDGFGTTSLLPDPFSRLSLDLLFAGDRILVKQAGARLGPGWAELGGSIRFGPDGPQYALTLKGKRIAYKNPAFFDGEAAELELKIDGGPLPLVRGTITISETRITVGSSRPGPPRPALPLEVRLVAGRNTRFFLPGVVDLPLNGEVRLKGTLAAPALAGTLNASYGTLFLYGQRFEITSATGTFLPERGYLPCVELEGRTTIRGTKVFVKVSGEVAEAGLTVNLWSEPALGREEILNLLSGTGRPEFIGGPRLFAVGMEFVLETLFGQLGERFRQLIDIDRFQISLDEDTGAFRLQLGKYVLDELYLSYEILFDEFGTRVWSFDYHLNRFLVLSGVFNSAEEPRWIISYQIKF
ncbi:MAG: translocation/assembly module TamB domain-containing protein [Bacillota bacterium]